MTEHYFALSCTSARQVLAGRKPALICPLCSYDGTSNKVPTPGDWPMPNAGQLQVWQWDPTLHTIFEMYEDSPLRDWDPNRCPFLFVRHTPEQADEAASLAWYCQRSTTRDWTSRTLDLHDGTSMIVVLSDIDS